MWTDLGVRDAAARLCYDCSEGLNAACMSGLTYDPDLGCSVVVVCLCLDSSVSLWLSTVASAGGLI